MAEYTQRDRVMGVSSPLGDDALLLRRMSANEQLSTPFSFELDLLSEDGQISMEDVIGQTMTVRLDLHGQGERYFNGYVSRFAHTGYDNRFAIYNATLVPWLWILTRTSDCRIFQEMTVPDIIKQVFRDAGFSDFDDTLSGQYRTWEYCVQYRETHFNFVSRLMEQEGIYYFFKHTDGKHTLVLADSYSSHEPVPNYEQITYHPPDFIGVREKDYIFDWSLTKTMRPGAYAQRDFDFEQPKNALLTVSKIPRSHAYGELEIYDYPGEYVTTSDGESYARVRMEELQADYETVRGEGYARGLAVGSLFTLTHYPREDQNREYLVVSANHLLESDLFETSGEAAEERVYQSSFTAIDAKEVYRPPRLTPKPVVQGPQTAIVVGKSGEEIWTDKHGRVKVQFHWDRYGESNENSSCWVRVSHPWAGQSWGAVAIPRIGQEVIVDFLEGDPDRPLITGRVYNGDNMPPYGLPAGAVVSGVKSNSTKGGGGYNEYVLDDTKGNELIREHGQYDKDSTIEHDLREHVLHDRSRDVTNNETIQVGNDRSKTIGHDETSAIDNDRTETVGSNETITIGSNRTEQVGANESISVGGNRTRNVAQNEAVTVALTRTHNIGVNEMVNIGAANEITVGGLQAVTVGVTRAVTVGTSQDTSIGTSHTESVGTSHSVSIGTDHSEKIGKNQSSNVGDNRTTSVGKDDSLKVGKNLVIDAGDSVVIKTGNASISMKKDGTITIDGKDITIKGSGAINVKASKNVVIKGQKILEN